MREIEYLSWKADSDGGVLMATVSQAAIFIDLSGMNSVEPKLKNTLWWSTPNFNVAVADI